jgi:hypothetical protein
MHNHAPHRRIAKHMKENHAAMQLSNRISKRKKITPPYMMDIFS